MGEELLLVTTEQGKIVLLEANPDEPVVLAEMTALEGKTWNPPALAGGYLLVRNATEAACYRMSREVRAALDDVADSAPAKR